jgi:hypothetical protein
MFPAARHLNSPCLPIQTLHRDAALVSCPKEQATRPRVLLWVIRVGLTEYRRLPVYPSEQTFSVKASMSQKCHHRKSVDFSITSSVHSSLPKHPGYKQEAREVLV